MDDDKLTTCLWFDFGEARKAADFYAATFPDSEVLAVRKAPADFPGGAAGDELLIEFTVLGRRFVGLNGGPQFTPTGAVSFMVVTEDQAETDRYWDAIVSTGGQEMACGWCMDRWGFAWQIVPRALLDGLADADPDVARRVMEAMMPMTRIDVATIEAAKAAVG